MLRSSQPTEAALLAWEPEGLDAAATGGTHLAGAGASFLGAGAFFLGFTCRVEG